MTTVSSPLDRPPHRDMPVPPYQRILSLWLPHFPAERVMRAAQPRGQGLAGGQKRKEQSANIPSATRPEAAEAPALVTVAMVKNAMRVAGLNAEAAARGIQAGQTLADARALHPVLVVHQADPEADRAALEALADAMLRFTPLVGLDAPDGLFLDITGCAHLFGGEAAMLDQVSALLSRAGYTHRLAIAGTVGAAWAAAHDTARPLGACLASGAEAEHLAPRPLAALRLSAQTVFALERLGLRTIGQIMRAPPAPLAARFGPGLLSRLDQALGRQGETISPRLPVPDAMAERRFAEPIALRDDIEAAIGLLCGHLVRHLEEHGLGARTLTLSLFRMDGAVSTLSVGTSRPLRDPGRMVRLFREKLNGLDSLPGVGLDMALDPGFGFDVLRLAASATAPLDARQLEPDIDLGLAGARAHEAAADLVDRLGARLGAMNIRVPAPANSHIPERASLLCRAGGAVGLALALDPRDIEAEHAWPHAAAMPLRAPERPLRLLAKPEGIQAVAEVPDGPPALFTWRRVTRRVRRVEGPERIAPEWWRDGPVGLSPSPAHAPSEGLSAPDETSPGMADFAHYDGQTTRDYFRIEDLEGRRYWVYREGLYGAAGAPPRWFMHGLFS